MIKKFDIFENHEDVDPYGEEQWDEPDLIKIDIFTILNVGDEIYHKVFDEAHFYGIIKGKRSDYYVIYKAMDNKNYLKLEYDLINFNYYTKKQ